LKREREHEEIGPPLKV